MKKRLGKLLALFVGLFVLTSCGKKENELVMVTEAGFAPYEYYENGEIVGVDIDIAKYLAKELGLKLVVKDVAFDSIINEVKSGKADIGAAGISYDEERAKEVDFTINYALSKQVVIVKKNSKIKSIDDIKKNKNLKIAVQLGSVSDGYATDNFKRAEITRQKKVLAAVQDLKTDKVDCVFVDELPAKEILKTNSDLKILDKELFVDNYGMVVKKGNKDLLTKVNKVLTKLKDEGKIDSYLLNHTK